MNVKEQVERDLDILKIMLEETTVNRNANEYTVDTLKTRFENSDGSSKLLQASRQERIDMLNRRIATLAEREVVLRRLIGGLSYGRE